MVSNSASDVCQYISVLVCVCECFVEEGNMTFPHFSFPPTRRHCKLYQKIIDFFSVLVLLSPLAETAQPKKKSQKHIFNTYFFLLFCFHVFFLFLFFFFFFFFFNDCRYVLCENLNVEQINVKNLDSLLRIFQITK